LAQFSLFRSGNDIYLNYVATSSALAVPEPNGVAIWMLLLGLSLMAVAIRTAPTWRTARKTKA
jgi:hypothetical protein